MEVFELQTQTTAASPIFVSSEQRFRLEAGS